MQSRRMPAGSWIRLQQRCPGLRHHVQVLHTRRHVARGSQVRQAHVAALRARLFSWPVVPGVGGLRTWLEPVA